LEMFDRVMRFRSNLPISETPPRKLPIYLVNNQGDLRQVRTTASRHTAGIYFPTEEDIFAVAIRRSAGGLDGEDVILHEYAHHFMLGMPGAYPAWFVEGFAEYYMTADIRDQEVILGGFNSNRAAWIMNATWLPLETLLRSHYSEVRQGSQQNTYYPIAWLLTHWLLNNDERRGQLAAYLEAVSEGGDPVTSMTDATGLSLQQLQSALRRYTRERLTQTTISGNFPEVPVEVVRLPRSADDLLLINQRLKVGVPQNDREALGRQVARIAARHGDDPLALLAAGHAGMHFGDPDAGRVALERLIEVDPNHVEALQFLAQDKLRLARETDDPTQATALRGAARAYLARAYAAGDNDYQTLMLLTQWRQGQENYPNENDMLTLGLALDRAPQLASIRFNYATALARRDDYDEAIAILRPLTNNPHGGGASEFAARMIEALETRSALPDLTGQAEEPEITEGEPEEPGEDDDNSPAQTVRTKHDE
ncbi:hypothetical protein LTR94_026025, partial [Friedmanniomyces endolithicus]